MNAPYLHDAMYGGAVRKSRGAGVSRSQQAPRTDTAALAPFSQRLRNVLAGSPHARDNVADQAADAFERFGLAASEVRQVGNSAQVATNS
jgi:hypothetical protein